MYFIRYVKRNTYVKLNALKLIQVKNISYLFVKTRTANFSPKIVVKQEPYSLSINQ